MFWIAVILTSVIVYLFHYLCIQKNRFDEHGIPTPKRHLYFSNTIKIFSQKISFITIIENLYNLRKDAKYIGYFDAFKPIIMLRDLELVKNITVKNFDHFVDHQAFIEIEAIPLFEVNLFSLREDKWRDVRGTLSPAFTSSKMKSMFKLMLERSENFTNHLVKNSPREINCKEMFTRYTNDVIATCAFGIAVDSMNNPHNDFYRFGNRAIKLSGWSMVKFMIARVCPRIAKLFKLQMISQDVKKFFYQAIRDAIITRNEKGIVRFDMLQLMMDAQTQKINNGNSEIDIESIASLAFESFIAGFDTTSNRMCFMALEIAKNKDIQEKLQREIDQVFEKCNGIPTYEAVNNMEYMDAIINETLRKYATGAIIDRLCTKEFELPPAVPGAKPFVVKPGDNIWVPIWSLHRDPEYFPEPEEFRPERFMSPEKEDLNTVAYMPFGAGPRMCIGNRFALMETKILFMYLFGSFNAKISKKMIMPLKMDGKGFNILVDGFRLDIEHRNKFYTA